MPRTLTLPLLLVLGLPVFAAAADSAGPVERRPVARGEAAGDARAPAPDLGTLAFSREDYRTLSRSLDAIHEQSSAEDAVAFFRHLREDRRPPQLQPGQWHALVNDAFGLIVRETPGGTAPVPLLAGLVRRAGDVVIRDYALQHLAILTAADDAPGRDEALALLREAAGWKDSPLSGTALINLLHLEDGVGDGALAGRALALAADHAAHEASRATALQVGVELGDERFLAPAVEIARRSHVAAHRVSALRAIAAFGGPEQETLLRQLRRRGPEPVSKIADQALAKLDNDA